MKDRVPTYPGRVKLTPVSGQANTYDMVRADSPTQEGTPINKDTLLKDTTATALGLTGDPTVDDAFRRLAKKSEYKVGDIKVTTRTDLGDAWALCDGSPLPAGSDIGDIIPPSELPKNWSRIVPKIVGSAVDACMAADGSVYVVSQLSSGSQYVYRFSQTGAVTGIFDISTIYGSKENGRECGSCCVARGNIYLYATSSTDTSKFSVFHAAYNGGDFPTSWAETQIPLMQWSGASGYYSGSGRSYKLRVTSSLFWFSQMGYYNSMGSAHGPVGYSSVLGTTPTYVTGNGSLSSAIAVDSAENVIIYTPNQAYINVYNGNTGAKLNTVSWAYPGNNICMVEDDTYTYLFGNVSTSSSEMTVYSKIYRANPADSKSEAGYQYNANLTSRVFKYNGNFYTLVGKKIYKIPNFGTFSTTVDTGVTLPVTPVAWDGLVGFGFGDTAFIFAWGGANNAWYVLSPAILPTITFDGAYAYIKVKEEIT